MFCGDCQHWIISGSDARCLDQILVEDDKHWNQVGFGLIYAEVEIPVASNLRSLVDKTLVDNLELIKVSSDVGMFYFTLGFK